MPFGRRRAAHRSRETRARDPFGHLADERRAAEAEAWFLQPDEGPDLDVQAGVSSNLSDDDLHDGGPLGATGHAGDDDVDAERH